VNASSIDCTSAAVNRGRFQCGIANIRQVYQLHVSRATKYQFKSRQLNLHSFMRMALVCANTP